MQFTTIFVALFCATLGMASPLPLVPATASPSTVATTTTTRKPPFALPTGGTTNCNVHCDPAFLRAADDEDPETGAHYRRACRRTCFNN